MTEDPRDEEYLDLFKPKPEKHAGDTQAPESSPSEAPTSSGAPMPLTGDLEADGPADDVWAPLEGELFEASAQRAEFTDRQRAQADRGLATPPDYSFETDKEIDLEPLIASPADSDGMLKSIGIFAGAGCLLIMLIAVVVFAFFQVFMRDGGDKEPQDTPTPTVVAVHTPSPTTAVAATPHFEPLVSSTDVRVPMAIPERLSIGDRVFAVQAVEALAGSWPLVPAAEDVVNWSYGTVVNYILSVASTSANSALVSQLRTDDKLSLHMSTGVILNFGVREVTTGVTGDEAVFAQVSPRLTLALLTDDLAQGTVVVAAFLDDEAQEGEILAGAAIGLVGTPVDQGPVRVTVLETYQAAAEQASLPPGTGYLLMDVTVENVSDEVLQPELFQTFVTDASGKRYPLTMMAEQFTHHGIPTDPLAPGETVIGSLGYLVPVNPEGEVRWVFNPVPGSDYWVVVPVSYELVTIPPTLEPTPPIGFAVVTVNASDIFVNQDDGLLDVLLRIENSSPGVVQVTQNDISLSSWTNGELTLVAPAPRLPWTIEPGELKLFQLQFELPSADSALLTVLGYTFSIENLSRE